MKCPKCGYDNKDGANHCDLCKEILAKPPEFGRPRTDLYQPVRSMEAPTRPERPIISFPSDDKINHTEAIKFGWEAMKEHFWLFMGIGAAFIGIYGVEWIMQLMVTGGGKGYSFASFFLQLAFAYLNIVIFTLGYNKVCLKMADGEGAEFSDLFSCFHLGGTFILVCFIMALMFIPVMLLSVLFVIMMKKVAIAGIIGFIGLLSLIIAISIIMLRFVFVSYLVIDKEMGAMESIKASWKITEGILWDMSLFFLLLSLVIIAGALCLGVGLLAAIPTVAVATAYYYRQMSKRL